MMFTALLLLLLLLLLLALARRSWGAQGTRTQGALPPGPTPLPLLGNLLQLESRRLDRALMELSGRWGPVFTVRLGPRPAVVLCGYSALRDALVLQADAFSGRGAMAVFERFTHGNGIVFSNGLRWRTLRNFALGALKEFGLGTRTIEERILEEAACLLGEFQATTGAPFDPRRLLGNAVSNVICSVVFGNRYGYEDPEFQRLLDLFNDNFRIMSSRWGEEQNDPESHFQEETLVMTTHNLFFGGTETTSTTLRYGLLILLKYPEVAAKVQAELDAVVGQSRTPRLGDREHLPYTNAVLHEIQRFISVLPLGLPRALTRDTHLHGYFLPKGTFVIPLLVSSHRDPTQFKDPDCFNPTNFLDDKGEFQTNDAFMPFAPGLGQEGGDKAGQAPGCLVPTLHPCVLRKEDVPGSRPGAIGDLPLLYRHPAAVLFAPSGEPCQHRPQPTVHWPGQHPPSLPAPSGGPLRAGLAALCSLAPRPPYPVWSIKALNCRWTGLLTSKWKQENQRIAALR
ncbi:cytochrome P450 2B4-like isoform X3 [Canis lupus dingo]|uniref:cytochrome P450 2B4-like isoform X3 n=1 Tax=Canis lupus dingo TaxID=286419 RepID=UPI0020C40C2A|nr:cytochrome P450 2B4-like isoform X3 [Canis lupus dingo]